MPFYLIFTVQYHLRNWVTFQVQMKKKWYSSWKMVFFSVFYNKNHHQNYSIVHVINGQGWNQHCYHPRGRQNHRHSSTQRQHRRTDGHPPQNHHLSPQNSRAREHPVHCGQSPEQRGRGTHHHIRWGSLFMQASIFVGKNLPKCLVGFQKLSAAI